MTWESLEKIYRKSNSDEEVLASVYARRFNAPFAKHLNFYIKQQGRKNEWQTFFNYTDDMIDLLTKIMQATTELKVQKQYLPRIALDSLYFANMQDEIIATNAIEGVNSSRREISEAMDKQKNKEPRNIRFWYVVNKYKKLKGNSHISFISCKDIREFYDEFVLDVVKEENATDVPDGEIFRKGSVSIGSGAEGKDLHQGVYPEAKIIEEMNKALVILHDRTVNGLIRIAVFHYLFGYIHPFYNGNGRVSRFISSYYLSKELDELIGLRLAVTIKNDVSKYYAMFKETNSDFNRGELTSFILGFLGFVYTTAQEEASKLAVNVKNLQKGKEKIKILCPKKSTLSNIYYILLQAALFSPNGVSAKEIAYTTHKTMSTAVYHLREIQEKNAGDVEINTECNPHRYKLSRKVVDEWLK
jgi:Fic family protein